MCTHMHKSVQTVAVIYTVIYPGDILLVSVHLQLDNSLQHNRLNHTLPLLFSSL